MPLSLFHPIKMSTPLPNKPTPLPVDQSVGLSDAVLLEKYAAKRDESALLTLLGRYETALYAHCLHLMRGIREDANDLYQETVTKVIQRLKRRPPPAHFNDYLFRVAINGSIDRFRKRKLESEYVLELQERLRTNQRRIAQAREYPLADLEALNEQQALLRSGLAQLDDEEATAVRLFFLRGKSYQQIAERTDQPLVQIKNTLQRARRKLRKWIKLQQQSL